MSVPLRLLLVEDSEEDASLLIREILRNGFDLISERVETPEAMLAALEGAPPDLVISDYVMPRFSGLAALKLIQEKGLDLPFIIVSGKIGEDLAVEAMKAGAHDYLLKDNLSRLVPAIRRELHEAEVRRERKQAEEALQQSEERFRTLGKLSLTGALTDITDRKQAEETLNKYQLLSEHTRDIVLYIRQRDGRIVEANNAAVKTYGYLREELLNMSIYDIYTEEAYQMIYLQMEQEDKSSILFETLHHKKDGSIFPVEVSSQGITINNERILLSIVRDITLRRQQEEKLLLANEVFENNLSGILVTSREGVIQRANPTFTKITGYSEEEVLGKNVSILGYDTQYNSQAMQTLSHANSYCGKAWNRSKDGTLFLEGFAINAIKDNEGQVLQYIKSFLDITEEEEIRKEKQHLREQKARMQRLVSLSALSAGIVHEISQPLNTIKLLADGMIYLYSKEDIFKLDEFIDNLKNISEQADQINVIISQMRSFASVGRITDSIPCNVNSAIKKIADILDRQLSAHGIILKTELEKNLPEVLGTPTVFEEVALNLIANSMHAFDAVGKPEKEIIIKTHLIDNKAIIEVSDNATGISGDIKESIFEPLFSTTKTDEGMGLGLSIVQSIVERFNGRIEVQNNTKGGATFMLAFPVVGGSKSE